MGNQQIAPRPGTYDLATDAGRELHQRIHPNGGRCPMLDGKPCIWQQRVARIEDEAAALKVNAAAATPLAELPAISAELGPFGDMCSSADMHYEHLHPEEREKA